MPTNTSTKNGQDPLVSKSKKSLRSSAPVKPPTLTKKTGTRRKPAAAAPAPVSLYAETVYEALPNPYHAPVAPYLWIDYPVQKEMLHAPEYVIRMGVGGEALVELCIDNGAWTPCRTASGYWWYDWSNIAPGEHILVARMKTFDGAWFRTPERQVYRNY